MIGGRLLALGAALLALASDASAEAAAPLAGGGADHFSQGVQALQRGASSEAVAEFEWLADRGLTTPNASFNRAVAYAIRAASDHPHPGDWGQAAAGLEETLAQTPGDAEALAALERIRRQIARRSVQTKKRAVAPTPALHRAAVELLSEFTWSILCALGSASLGVGLLLRWLARHPARRLAGAIAAWGGVALACLAGSATLAARHWRRTLTPAVVIASRAPLLDGQGRPIAARGDQATAIPEAARVDIVERRGRLAEVQWGSGHGWVSADQLRRVAVPPVP